MNPLIKGPGCTLCNELSGFGEPNPFREIVPEFAVPTRRIVDSFGRYVAFPSLGQLVAGHMLICPCDHHLSMGDCLTDVDSAEELCVFLDQKCATASVRYITPTRSFLSMGRRFPTPAWLRYRSLAYPRRAISVKPFRPARVQRFLLASVPGHREPQSLCWRGAWLHVLSREERGCMGNHHRSAD